MAPQEKLGPLGGAVARIFPNVSLAKCPPKTLLGPLLARLWRRYRTEPKIMRLRRGTWFESEARPSQRAAETEPRPRRAKRCLEDYITVNIY